MQESQDRRLSKRNLRYVQDARKKAKVRTDKRNAKKKEEILRRALNVNPTLLDNYPYNSTHPMHTHPNMHPRTINNYNIETGLFDIDINATRPNGRPMILNHNDIPIEDFFLPSLFQMTPFYEDNIMWLAQQELHDYNLIEGQLERHKQIEDWPMARSIMKFVAQKRKKSRKSRKKRSARSKKRKGKI